MSIQSYSSPEVQSYPFFDSILSVNYSECIQKASIEEIIRYTDCKDVLKAESWLQQASIKAHSIMMMLSQKMSCDLYVAKIAQDNARAIEISELLWNEFLQNGLLPSKAQSYLQKYMEIRTEIDACIEYISPQIASFFTEKKFIYHTTFLRCIAACAELPEEKFPVSNAREKCIKIAQDLRKIDTFITSIAAPLLRQGYTVGDICFSDNEKEIRVVKRMAGEEFSPSSNLPKLPAQCDLLEISGWLMGRFDHVNLCILDDKEYNGTRLSLSDCGVGRDREGNKSEGVKLRSISMRAIMMGTILRIQMSKLWSKNAQYCLQKKYDLRECEVPFLLDALFQGALMASYKKAKPNFKNITFSFIKGIKAQYIPQILPCWGKTKTDLTDEYEFCAEHVSRFVMRAGEDVAEAIQKQIKVSQNEYTNPFRGWNPESIVPKTLYSILDRFSKNVSFMNL